MHELVTVKLPIKNIIIIQIQDVRWNLLLFKKLITNEKILKYR